jgi:hypothetical protein
MTETYDDIEWEIDDFPSTSSSGDEPDTWILEFNAKGVDENGIEVDGTAFYTETPFGTFFDYVEYDSMYEDYVEEDDEE